MHPSKNRKIAIELVLLYPVSNHHISTVGGRGTKSDVLLPSCVLAPDNRPRQCAVVVFEDWHHQVVERFRRQLA